MADLTAQPVEKKGILYGHWMSVMYPRKKRHSEGSRERWDQIMRSEGKPVPGGSL
ncbi:MAG: hypothetical protein ACREQW_12940 [Candidatus Binatia bacterium]